MPTVLLKHCNAIYLAIWPFWVHTVIVRQRSKLNDIFQFLPSSIVFQNAIEDIISGQLSSLAHVVYVRFADRKGELINGIIGNIQKVAAAMPIIWGEV